MGKVNSHLSEEERQVIQIEVGNGTSVRKIARLLGRCLCSMVLRPVERLVFSPKER